MNLLCSKLKNGHNAEIDELDRLWTSVKDDNNCTEFMLKMFASSSKRRDPNNHALLWILDRTGFQKKLSDHNYLAFANCIGKLPHSSPVHYVPSYFKEDKTVHFFSMILSFAPYQVLRIHWTFCLRAFQSGLGKISEKKCRDIAWAVHPQCRLIDSMIAENVSVEDYYPDLYNVLALKSKMENRDVFLTQGPNKKLQVIDFGNPKEILLKNMTESRIVREEMEKREEMQNPLMRDIYKMGFWKTSCEEVDPNDSYQGPRYFPEDQEEFELAKSLYPPNFAKFLFNLTRDVSKYSDNWQEIFLCLLMEFARKNKPLPPCVEKELLSFLERCRKSSCENSQDGILEFSKSCESIAGFLMYMRYPEFSGMVDVLSYWAENSAKEKLWPSRVMNWLLRPLTQKNWLGETLDRWRTAGMEAACCKLKNNVDIYGGSTRYFMIYSSHKSIKRSSIIKNEKATSRMEKKVRFEEDEEEDEEEHGKVVAAAAAAVEEAVSDEDGKTVGSLEKWIGRKLSKNRINYKSIIGDCSIVNGNAKTIESDRKRLSRPNRLVLQMKMSSWSAGYLPRPDKKKRTIRIAICGCSSAYHIEEELEYWETY